MAEHDVKHDIAPTHSYSKHEAHGTQELKDIYGSIIRLNKDAPFCIVDTSSSAQKFAISLKESARSLKNTILSLGRLDEQILFHKKIAVSSNPNIAIATYIADEQHAKYLPSFSINVKALATPQINTGKHLVANEIVSLIPNTYSFDLLIHAVNYEFQFNINKNDTHEMLLQRLARLINNAGIGVLACIICNDEEKIALSISSKAIGLPDKQKQIFQISDQKTSRRAGIVSYLGLNMNQVDAANAAFFINSKEQFSAVNEFTVEKMFHITLTGISKSVSDSALISTKQDAESVLENINIFITCYHHFIDTAESYLTAQPQVGKLLYKMQNITLQHKTELERLGIYVNENARLDLQKKVFLDTVNNLMRQKDLKTTYFQALTSFADEVLSKTNDVQLNPMEFVDKKTVAYKNPEAPNYPCPYISSDYSGMMYNKFC